jgi:hypothetical protein
MGVQLERQRKSRVIAAARIAPISACKVVAGQLGGNRCLMVIPSTFVTPFGSSDFLQTGRSKHSVIHVVWIIVMYHSFTDILRMHSRTF